VAHQAPAPLASADRPAGLNLKLRSVTSAFRNFTVDCRDARALATFWAEVLGWNVYFDGDPEVLVAPSFPPPAGPTMLFIPVPEQRSVKNRMHVDLQPHDRTRDEEVARLLALGASVVEDHRNENGSGWVWLADPEGNDFCVERSAAERSGPSGAHSYRITEGH
jgi:predicted enzyme related to lactoylglutathione lyase